MLRRRELSLTEGRWDLHVVRPATAPGAGSSAGTPRGAGWWASRRCRARPSRGGCRTRRWTAIWRCARGCVPRTRRRA
ncbi:hypothetical protein NKH77_31075 [Streptomyces sp. M19]